MSSVNKATILGYLAASPEIHTFSNGGRVANLRIATSEKWKDKNTGEKKEKTEWHNVAIFSDGLVNVVERYIKKGSRVYIEGQLETRKWQDQSGNDRYTTQIVLRGFNSSLVMLDSKSVGDSGSYQNNSPGPTVGSGTTEMDDDIPF